jgi:Gluconate 2-dehydrogenase subunit 3
MSDLSRRDVLRTLAATIAGAGAIDRLAAARVHDMAYQAAQASGGTYSPVAFSAHEYDTLVRLTDLVIPMENGKPGAVAAGVPEWIDMLAGANDQLKASYVSGFAWIDAEIQRRGAADFVRAAPAEQTGLLDLIAYRRNNTAELAPAIQFFTLLRRMTVDGFYTSRIGMRDIYLGNVASATFAVPPEAIQHALTKSGL